MSTLSLRLPDSIHNKLKEVSQHESISINQFISSAVSEKLSAFLTEEYITKRANRAIRESFLDALNQVPDCEPDEFDRI